MQSKCMKYCSIFEQTYTVKSFTNGVILYQCLDIVQTIVQIATQETDDMQFLLVYRIIAQVGIMVIFHSLLTKLTFNYKNLTNLAYTMQYISLNICWYETEYYMTSEQQTILQHAAFRFDLCFLLAVFLFMVQSQVLQTVLLIFSTLYTLLRFQQFEWTTNDYVAAMKIIVAHSIIMIILLLYSKELTEVPNSTLIDLGNQNPYSSINSNRKNKSAIRTIQDMQHLPINIDVTCQTPKQNILFDTLMAYNSQCGIYLLDNVCQNVTTISSVLSHIALEDELLSQSILDQLIDEYPQDPTIIGVYPQFNRSQDISQFISFIKHLKLQEPQEPVDMFSTEIMTKQIQFFAPNMKIKTLIDHFHAFLMLKHQSSALKKPNVIDFTLKFYGHKDNFHFAINLTPLYRKKLQLVMYIYDISEEPSHRKLVTQNEFIDTLITDISSKIKQPLNCTISMLEISMKTQEQSHLFAALSGCKLLLGLANDIIDYATLRRQNKLTLRMLDICLQDFILDLVHTIQSQASFRGIDIQVNVRGNIPKFIKTDPNRLGQILMNLMTLSLQATIQGSICIQCVKSAVLPDYIDIRVKVTATETKQQLLNNVDETLKLLDLARLRNTMPELKQMQHSQSLLISYYLILNLSNRPLNYSHLQLDQSEEFQFEMSIENTNPNFEKSFRGKRQSAIVQCSSLKKEFNADMSYRKYMTSRLTLQMGQPTIVINQVRNNNEIHDIVSEDSYESIDVENKLDKIVELQPQFIQHVQLPTEQLIVQDNRPYTLTFGAQSGMYVSMGFSTGILQPNDLIDCFEKMEQLRLKKFAMKCDCSKVLIAEDQNLDLFALSHQLQNIGFNFDYVMQREITLDKIIQLEKSSLCCNGYELVLIGVDSYDPELLALINKIKEHGAGRKQEYKIICLVGCQEQDCEKVKKLPFHDFLAKPIMIDALLFMLAKWIKL